MTHELWATLNEKMVDYLDSVSLQDLVDQQKQKNAEQNVVALPATATTPLCALTE
jgi:Rrf2 family iron-sulfur cluster assembly transcriptional regulator